MKRTIIISPYSRNLRNNKKNPKNYPRWEQVVKALKQEDYYIIQVGVAGENPIDGVDEVKYNLPLTELTKLVKDCDTWMSIDNFFPHFCSHLDKPGVVVWGKSDPAIFGYVQNINLLKSRTYLRKFQFDIWESESYTEECFVSADIVINAVKDMANR